VSGYNRRPRHCGIYLITHTSGRAYVGKSLDLSNRWNGHITDLLYGRHHNKGLQELFDAAGEGNNRISHFTFQILELCGKKEVGKRERHYISKYAAELGDHLLNVADNPRRKKKGSGAASGVSD